MTGSAARAATIVALTVTFLMGMATSAAAKPGALRPDFGTNGRQWTLQLPKSVSWGGTRPLTAVAPDGSIYVVSSAYRAPLEEIYPPQEELRLARYRPNGELDLTFGSGEPVVISIPELTFTISDLLVDRRGRAVLVGTAFGESTSFQMGYPFGDVYPANAAAMRYDSNGALDPSFGDGDGIALFDFDLSFKPPYEKPAVYATRAAIDRRNRIVFVVARQEVVPTEAHPVFGLRDKLIARLLPNGGLDPSFGTENGVYRLAVGTRVDQVITGPREQVALLATATANAFGPTSTKLLRLTRYGLPNKRFGRGGVKRVADWVSAVAVDSRGRLLLFGQVAGREGSSAQAVRRLLPSGRVDTSFGRRGGIRLDLPGPSYATAIAPDSRGGLYLTATLFQRASQHQPWTKARRSFLVLHRLPTGEVDRRFGRRGWAITRFGRYDAGAFAAAEAPRHTLVVSGFAKSSTVRFGPSTVVLAKYEGARP